MKAPFKTPVEITSGRMCTINNELIAWGIPLKHAPFIATAINSHERDQETIKALVAAVDRCLSHFEKIRAQNDRDYDSPMMAQCRAALALAKGAKP
jgi:flagellar biosynthesis component FlhA